MEDKIKLLRAEGRGLEYLIPQQRGGV